MTQPDEFNSVGCFCTILVVVLVVGFGSGCGFSFKLCVQLFIMAGDLAGYRDKDGPSYIPTAKERLALLTKGAEFPIEVTVPPARYLVSAKPLYETARYEASQGNFQKAYLLFIRYLDLIITKLPQHPKYKETKEDLKAAAKKNVKEALNIAEEVKAKVLRELEEEYVYEVKQAEEEERRKRASTAHTQAAPPRDRRSVDGILQNISALNGGFPSAPPDYDASSHIAWPQPGSFYDQADNESSSADGTFPPSFDRSLKPTAPPRLSKSAGTTRAGPPPSPAGILRPVRIPGDLVAKFTETARENTEKKNIETCGHLYGNRDAMGSYVVTHLLIPKQKGTDSYCEDLDDESKMATYAISRDLMQLGWIHTHPTQSAFLSSVDLHMQWGYQMMLPEAIAIVVAPAYNDVAVFRLDEFGMQYISQCEHGTNFHSHDTSQLLFERVEDVISDTGLFIKMEDFR